MKKLRSIPMILLTAAAFVSACSKDDDDDYNTPPPPEDPKVTVVSAAGDLTAALAQFRGILGDSLNTTLPGSAAGRREINWDGVPANLTNNNNFPFDFFNSKDAAIGAGRKRGLEYVNTGNSLRVDSSSYAEIEPTYANEFKPFSGKRLFAYANTNITEAFFKMPGTNTNATVKGFGVVFSDVDDANSTSIQFFNGNKNLGKFKVPVRKDANGFSFLGVHFPDEKITHVRIVAGSGLLQAGNKDVSAGGTKDIVVMDDFFYSEPQLAN